MDPDGVDLPDYRKWLVDGKPVSDGLNLAGLKPADGGVQSRAASLPYTPPYMAVWEKRVATAAAGRPVATVGAYCWPLGVIARYHSGPGVVVTSRGVIGRVIFEITQTPGRVLIAFPGGPGAADLSRIYTDGRPHPDLSPEDHTMAGHTIGHWRNDGVLVTDTIGVRKEGDLGGELPHSDAIHVVTTYRVTPDKRHMDVSFHITDRKALAKPVELKLRFRKVTNGELPNIFCEGSTAGGIAPDADGYMGYEPPKTLPGWDLPED
ncbi:MAG: hypothetical protein QM718_08875 [Steroidobacteraceae bacterium]